MPRNDGKHSIVCMTVLVTVDSLAESLFFDLMATVIRQVSVTSHSRYYTLQGFTHDHINPTSSLFVESSTKDVFGQDKSKLKGSETSRYFECGNCGRKVSGGRFASHINKCLDRNRK